MQILFLTKGRTLVVGENESNDLEQTEQIGF